MQEIRQHIWQKYIDDDVMTWGCTHKGPVMWNFEVSIIVRLINLNKQSSCRWFDPPPPDSKVQGANMGPTWVLSAPDGPHFGPMNLGIRAMMLVWLYYTVRIAIICSKLCLNILVTNQNYWCLELISLIKSTNWKDSNKQNHKRHIDGLVQGRLNSIVNALDLRLSCTKPSTW